MRRACRWAQLVAIQFAEYARRGMREEFSDPGSIPGASTMFGNRFAIASPRAGHLPFLYCAKPPYRKGRFSDVTVTWLVSDGA